jgi:regulator of protease activity HflC (stomatin/prohibitin superfamily)
MKKRFQSDKLEVRMKNTTYSSNSAIVNNSNQGSHISGISTFMFIVALVIGFAGGLMMFNSGVPFGYILLYFGFWFFIGVIFMYSLRVAQQWEKGVLLRLGKFRGLRGPGVFWVMPFIDSVPAWIDQRVKVTPYSAEKTLTKDTVPVNVDAVLFWVIWDAEKAALEVEDYRTAITWAAQTALRDLIGQMALADILLGRSIMDAELQKIIDQRTTPWGITVQSVEIRDVVIPADLEDAMSRQAQAERERQARVILGESEKQIAENFAIAAESYQNNPTALHLRAMNMLYEGLKEKGALVIVPSSAVESMNLGGISGLVAMAQNTPAMVEAAKKPAAAVKK